MEFAQNIKALLQNLPDAEAAERFFAQLGERHPAEAAKLLRSNSQSLLADILALASWSPFLAATMLQHKEYLAWLGRKRGNTQICTKEDLLESLGRFSLTNSQLDAHVLLSRFRRRELLRIYLRDVRGLATIAEITAELSNLADAILEFALKTAYQELENRYGAPLASDERGRTSRALFNIISLGKLGSQELNYASDIDLLFIYSSDGATAGAGEKRAAITNKEFFIKLSELITKIVGQATGEGAAYRVDLRLRPHGRVGALAISVAEAVQYYREGAARDWERQVLLRARGSAGDAKVFKTFAAEIKNIIYRSNISVAAALESVRLSKQRINREHAAESGFNVKLGRGGIREIEFIAQALQLAYGGKDEWLRVPHTLISLSRLADREHLSKRELAMLSDAYSFLRFLEHHLQMENGLQTHSVPEKNEKRALIAQKMNFPSVREFDQTLEFHCNNVSDIFTRVFENRSPSVVSYLPNDKRLPEERKSFAKSEPQKIDNQRHKTSLELFCASSPHFSERLAANLQLLDSLPTEAGEIASLNYAETLATAVSQADDFHDELATLRVFWSKFYLQIAALDALGKIEMRESNRLQTALAEASLGAALIVVHKELARKFKYSSTINYQLPLAVLALGRLGGRGMDYGSDLDLVLIFDETQKLPFSNLTPAEFYGRAAEILVTALSSLTREGYLYRVDLRLRPDGKNGATVNGRNAFLNYLETRAAIWELLAYVKLRSVGADSFAAQVEIEARNIIYAKARHCEVADLKVETKRIRNLLEQQKTKEKRSGEIDIKHGAGGLLDIYFAVRFLQLRHTVFDEDENRSTSFSLQKLSAKNLLTEENFEILNTGYEFLRHLDHALRLVSGRSTRLPNAGNPLLSQIATRLKYDSAIDLMINVSFQMANIRQAFENILA